MESSQTTLASAQQKLDAGKQKTMADLWLDVKKEIDQKVSAHNRSAEFESIMQDGSSFQTFPAQTDNPANLQAQKDMTDYFQSLSPQDQTTMIDLIKKYRTGWISDEELKILNDLNPDFVPDLPMPEYTGQTISRSHGDSVTLGGNDVNAGVRDGKANSGERGKVDGTTTYANEEDTLYGGKDIIFPSSMHEEEKAVPSWKSLWKADGAAAVNIRSDTGLSDFFKQNGTSKSVRVQSIMEDTYQKLDRDDLTKDEKSAILNNASSRVNDNSMFQLMGEYIWFQDEAYHLSDPTSNLDLTKDESAINEKGIIRGFHLAQALGGTELEDDGALSDSFTKGQAATIGIVNALQVLVDNIYVNDLQVVLQEASDGSKHAYLLAGSSDTQKQMTAFAGTTQLMVRNAYGKHGYGAFLNALDYMIEFYEQATGKKTDEWLDLKMSFDPKHENEPYYGYIVGEENGNIRFVSQVYPGDRLEIVEFWNQTPVYDLTDKINSLYSAEDGISDVKLYLQQVAEKVENKLNQK